MSILSYSELSTNLFKKVYSPFKVEMTANLDNSKLIYSDNRINKYHKRIDEFPNALNKKIVNAKLDSSWNKTPDNEIYEIKNAFSLNNIYFDSNGICSIDSARFFTENKNLKDFSFALSTKHTPIQLNEQYYTHKTIKSIDSIRFIKGYAIPFYTFNYYGHYLLESLPYLYNVHKLGIKPKILLQADVTAVPTYILDMIKPFNLTKDDIILSQDLLFFEKLILQNKLVMNGRFITPTALECWEFVRKFYYKKELNLNYDKIFVSKKSYSHNPIENKDVIEDFFRSRGYKIIYAEDYSYYEEITMFSNAKIIAGYLGSGMINPVFNTNPNELKVLILAPANNFHFRTHVKVITDAGINLYMFQGSQVDAEKERKGLPCWNLDLNFLKKFCNTYDL